MHTFKTKPDGFRQIRRTMFFRDLPVILLAFSLGMLLSEFRKPEIPINWYLMGTIILIFAVIIAFVFLRTMTEQRHMYEDFVLTIDEDGISREQYRTDTITIARHEVSKIYKKTNGSLVIKGTAYSEAIITPSQMEESEKLEQELAGIKSFSQIPFLEKYWLIPVLTVLSLIAVINFVTNKWLIGISGLTLLGLYGYSLYRTHGHKNIFYYPKSSIFFLLYLMFTIVRRMYSTIIVG